MSDGVFAKTLLGWYDSHARTLPWRVGPKARAVGQIPDAYGVWLSEIMLQQTTVVTVKDYYLRFMARWPTVGELAAADDAHVMAEWAGLGYYARARNLLKCARVVVREHGGEFPGTYESLLTLPGFGPYTAAAVAAIAFDEPETVLDGNVKRVMARYFAVQDVLEQAMPQLMDHAKLLTPKQRSGDYAQAIMDLGATVCRPKNPDCGRCPVADQCRAKALGNVAELPRRAVKSAKPTRRGMVYVARRGDGAWLLERRADEGLLGGMLGWPGSAWGDQLLDAPPFQAGWVTRSSVILHTFTHFHLQLSLRTTSVDGDAKAAVGAYLTEDQFRRTDLPTVMRKVYDAARPAFNLD